MSSGPTGKDESSPANERIAGYLPWHILTYCAVLLAVALLQFLAPGNWGVFWPMMIWAIVLLIHLLVVKARSAGQKWADERSSRILQNATDLSHIEAVRERHEARTAQRNCDAETTDPCSTSGDVKE